MEIAQLVNPAELGIMGLRSLSWYGHNGQHQYTQRENLSLYDQAAEVLTNRKAFGQFLVDRLGSCEGRTLELAAGTGLVSPYLERAGANVTFMDLSAACLELLAERVSKPQVVQANFLHLPFQDAAFRTIVCVGGYRYVPHDEKDTFWQEATRVLEPGGKMLFGQFKPRGVPINGTTLKDDVTGYGLEQVDVDKFASKVSLGNVSIKSGAYSVVEYQLK